LHLLNEYYAFWVRKFYFSISKLTIVILPKLLIYLMSDTKNKLSKVCHKTSLQFLEVSIKANSKYDKIVEPCE